ncbi:TRAP transporter large permease [Martelella soudanensis]|uniref:TRAP transporter large permease n=1 Tax=unclassified Martelella TaxID=2629616 RepID=UPI0015DE3925|nr:MULTISPECIES: TRAP transporter large permease [unclassified Martelella]
MDPLVFAALSIVSIVALIVFGVPVAFSIMAVTITGMYFLVGDAFLFTTFKTLTFASSSSYAFAVIPMFVLMGEIAGRSRIIGDLYEACYKWLGGFRSGVYASTVLASAGFAAISGSTIVNAAVFTRVALPEIVRLGYNRGFGAGCIAASGALAAMIPPSITMVLYGVLTEQSVGRLLIAGIIPGFLTAAGLLLVSVISVALRKELAPVTTERFTMREKVGSLVTIWPAALLAAVVLGGIYTGAFSPSAAGTVGAVGALAITVLRGRFSLELFFGSLKSAAITTASLFLIIIAGTLLARLLLFSGSVTTLTSAISDSGLSPQMFMVFIVISYFVMGMFIDPVSMMVITIPFLFPAVIALDIDPIWFGIIIVKMVELAAITPPIGINLFAVISASDGQVKAKEIFIGVLPFIVMEIIVLILLFSFPVLSIALPSMMLSR